MQEQEVFLSRAMPLLESDSRLVGVAVGGSRLTGGIDAYSDIDLVLAVEPSHYEGVLQDRMQIAERLGPLLSAFTGEHVGEPRLVICLYGPPLLHVDLKFVSLLDLAQRVEDPTILWQRDERLTEALSLGTAQFPQPELQWIEDRFWVWLHYTAAKLGRGELFEVIGALTFLREKVLGPLALMRGGHLPRGVRRIEWNAPEVIPALMETVSDYDPAHCKRAIQATAALYRELRDFHAPPALLRRTQAEIETQAYLDQIET